MIIFFRFLPLLTALIEVGVFYFQAQHPLSYPWIALIGVLALPTAVFAMTWRRSSWQDTLEKMLPSFILIASLAFALLLVEGSLAIWVLICVAGIASFISLELLFLHAYYPARYPVNGLSRVNIAYVPIALWYAVSTSIGLLTFLHFDRVWHVVGVALLSGILFRTTGHVGATQNEKRTWTLIGTCIGIQVGLLGLLLPLSMPMQGIIAALILSASLRARRYVVDPRPTRRQALIEGAGALIAFVAVLSTARWL